MFQFHETAKKKLKSSRGVAGLAAKSFTNISLIPTYAENSPKAIIPNQLWNQQFSQSLRWENFCWVVERLLNTQELEAVFFSGGEATLWAELDKAIYYLRKKKVKTYLSTNGILHTKKSLPDGIYLNLQTYLNFPELRVKIEDSIQHYRQTNLTLRLYSSRQEENAAVQLAQDLAQRSQVRLELYPSFFAEALRCDNCFYSGITIQPDGNTITLCRFLPISAQLGDYLSLREAYEKDLLPKLRKQSKCLAQLLRQ